MADNREYEEGTVYEAGVGIYFSDGEDHTNINVEDEILAQINQNTEDIEALDTRMTTAEGNISALDGRLTTAEGDIDNLEGRMTTAEGDIDALEGRMNTAEGDITTLQGRMTTAEGDIDSLEGRMNTAESDIDALEGRMTTAEGDIDAVELRVTAIENNPTTVDVGTTTTGAEGTQASVTNSGTTHNAVFNFTIPKGDTGATGATGPQGPTGPAGPGVAAGGTAGQVLSKVDGTDYNTQWVTPSSVEKYTIATFNSSNIPATAPFCWFIEGAKTTTATADYTSYLPLLKTQVSRSGWNYLSCYLFRKEESGSIYALFVGVDYYTLFVRRSAVVTDNIWSCVTPMPGSSFLFSMSGSTPTLTLITMSYSATISRPQIQCDPETLLADNTSNKIIRAKFIATVVFDASSVDAVKSIQVPMVVGPNGSCFEFLYNNSGTLYRIVCKRTSANTWTATATAI